jgi:hypothetical protein
MTAYLAGVQERLRRSELARLEAQARVIQERAARRLTVTVAASVLALAVVGAGGWMFVKTERDARLSRTLRKVDEAMARAADARGRAEESGGDAARWADALRAVDEAAELLAGEDVEPETRRRVETTRADIGRLARAAREAAERAEADRRLLARLTDGSPHHQGRQRRPGRCPLGVRAGLPRRGI